MSDLRKNTMEGLLRPGEWVDCTNTTTHKPYLGWRRKIYTQNHTPQSPDLIPEPIIIVYENPSEQPPEQRFLIKIREYDQVQKSIWALHDQCCGFLWEIVDTDEQKAPESIIESKKDIWVDFIVTNKKKAMAHLSKMDFNKFRGLFCSPHPNMSIRKFDKFLNQLPVNILQKISKTRPHDLKDELFSDWPLLDTFHEPLFVKNSLESCSISVIVPHFETPYFLCNLIRHVEAAASLYPDNVELIIVDDSSREETLNYIKNFIIRHTHDLAIKIFQWQEKYHFRSGQKIFRAGASRNWGATYSSGKYLLFLDSDMLMSPDGFNLVESGLKKYDIMQFARWHVPVDLSNEAVLYKDLVGQASLYVEEAKYWSPLFNCNNWSDLPDYWKYTCTYALAVSRELFFSAGRFRRNYIQYGFEDTDLGYRLYQLGKKFYLEKTPFLHLSNRKDSSQSWTYSFEKVQRMKPMAKKFYALNYNAELYSRFQGLFD